MMSDTQILVNRGICGKLKIVSNTMHWFIKLWLILLAIIFILGFILFIRPKFISEKQISNSEISGIIWRNERWSGVIRVKGDILSVPGSVVTAEPGTKILVETAADKSNMDFIPIHNRAGINDSPTTISSIRHGEPFLDEGQKISIRLAKFFAAGTKEQPITIESAALNKSPYDFNTFSIYSGIIANTKLSNYRRLEVGNVTIRNSAFSDIGECAVCTTRANPNILHNTFNNSLRDYIWIEQGSPVVKGNIFLPAKANGVVIDPKRLGSPKILNNEFQLPGKSSVYFLSGNEKNGGIVSNNLFAAGDITIPCDSRVKISQNHIKSNLQFIKSGNCVGEIKIGLNYWEIESPEEVTRVKVIGTEKQFKVVIEGVLPKPPLNIGVKI